MGVQNRGGLKAESLQGTLDLLRVGRVHNKSVSHLSIEDKVGKVVLSAQDVGVLPSHCLSSFDENFYNLVFLTPGYVATLGRAWLACYVKEMRCSQSAMDVQERAHEIEQVCARYCEVRSKVRELALRHHGSSEAVALLLASKRQPAWILEPLVKDGARLFGENYVQEARAKMAELQGLSVEWHLIGRLQANKAKKAIESFSVIQTLDTVELAQRLNSLAENVRCRVRCLVEVNIGAEPTKAGVFPGDLMGFLEKMLSFCSLEVLGLMAIPPLELEIDASRRHFERMCRLFQGAKDAGYPMHWLSMGTSHDFEHAIGAGANMVRVGTRVFGPRQAGKLQ
jgi:hypothetical protein